MKQQNLATFKTKSSECAKQHAIQNLSDLLKDPGCKWRDPRQLQLTAVNKQMAISSKKFGLGCGFKNTDPRLFNPFGVYGINSLS